MPAAAVIPAPIAYIKVVAVKKLVVECRGVDSCRSAVKVCTGRRVLPSGMSAATLYWAAVVLAPDRLL